MSSILKALCLVLICVLSAPYYAACEKSLRIVRVGSEGLDDQIAKRILDRAGCTIELVRFEGRVPLDRRMSLLQSGHIDMIIAVNKRPERELFGNFSIAFQDELIKLWTTPDKYSKFADQSLPQLIANGVRVIGPSAGYFGPDYELLKQADHPQLVLYKDVSDGLKLLLRNRGDVFLGSFHFKYYFPEAKQDKIKKLPQVIHQDGFHFMFSKTTVSQATIDLIDKTIREMKSEPIGTE